MFAPRACTSLDCDICQCWCNVPSWLDKITQVRAISLYVLACPCSFSFSHHMQQQHQRHTRLPSNAQLRTAKAPHSPLLNHTAAFILDIVSHRPAGGRGWIHTNFVDVSLYVEWVGGGSGTAMRHDRASLRDIRGRQLLGTKQWRFHSDKKQKLDKCKHRDV